MALRFKRNDQQLYPAQDVLDLLEKGDITPVRAFTMLPQGKKEPIGKATVVQGSQRKKVEEVLAELDALIGLLGVKTLVKELQAFVEIQKRRQQENLATDSLVLHMIFKGNPGTGKTTVARIIGRLFKEIGVLEKGHIVEVERADLVGEYIGHTAQKTREMTKKAQGGILFIDEAYSLARGGEKDFGKEAIDALVKTMEDHKDNLVLILAGYHDEMVNFLQINPGLRSRFPIHLTFQDYNIAELLAIADLMLKEREYKLDKEAKIELAMQLSAKTGSGFEHSGNARLVRNLLERAIRRQAVRLVNIVDITKEQLMLLTKYDFREG